MKPIQSIALAGLLFPLVAAASIVRVETPLGRFYIDLLEEQAPNTVANFLNYVRDERFENSVVHRTEPGFVIQGGGFTFDGDNFIPIATDAPVGNEFGESNTRGTVAMAKLTNDPDSATSQWFINMDDNSENLDSQNGGFTVFGRIMGNGMEVVDRLNSLLRVNIDGGALAAVPVLLNGSLDAIESENVLFTIITEVTGFEINAGLSGAWFNAATAGQGWLLDIIDSGERREVFVAWFTYDVEAPTGDDADAFGSTQHRWLTASGSFDGDTATLTIFRNTGGVFNDPTETMLEAIGTMTIRFFDCGTAEISWDFDDDQYPDDTVTIIRLSPDAFCTGLALPST